MGRAGWVAGLATVALAVGTGVAVGQSGGSHPATVPAGSVTLTSCHILLPADGYPRAERSSHRACIGIERVSVDSRGWVVITATDSSIVSGMGGVRVYGGGPGATGLELDNFIAGGL